MEVVVGGTDPGPLHAIADGAATAAADRQPQGAAVAEAIVVALPDQAAEVHLPGGALPALTAGHLQGMFAQLGLAFVASLDSCALCLQGCVKESIV